MTNDNNHSRCSNIVIINLHKHIWTTVTKKEDFTIKKILKQTQSIFLTKESVKISHICVNG